MVGITAKKLTGIMALWLGAAQAVALADQRTSNWQGDYSPCDQKFEWLKQESMDIGVKFSTSNPLLEREFRSALDFWTKIVDMKWHEDNSSSCALQLVDGTSAILKTSIVARSQFTEWDNFQGWIAFNPKAPLTSNELYLTAVHEIGHMLGLKHNPNVHSIMYYLDLEGTVLIDRGDLASLAARHRLRIASLADPVTVLPGGGYEITPIPPTIVASAAATADPNPKEAEIQTGGDHPQVRQKSCHSVVDMARSAVRNMKKAVRYAENKLVHSLG